MCLRNQAELRASVGRLQPPASPLPHPSNFIAGRDKAARLFGYSWLFFHFLCLWSSYIVATCIADQFSLFVLYN